MILRITSDQLRLLREEARRNHPIETCALLFGKLVDGNALVRKIVITPNVLQSTTRFEVDSEAVYAAFKQADQEGIRFIGLFHSHPAPAYPSAADLRYMRLWEEAVWLILSSINGDVAAFQMIKGEVHETKIKLDDADFKS